MHEAAENAGPVRIGVIEGEVLLGQAAALYERALELLDDLDRRGMDQRARVAAYREVRMALETLAKLSFAVEDRGRAPEGSTMPALDAAIIDALRARDVNVDVRSTPSQPAQVLALPAAST